MSFVISHRYSVTTSAFYKQSFLRKWSDNLHYQLKTGKYVNRFYHKLCNYPCHKHSLPPNDLSVTSLFGLSIKLLTTDVENVVLFSFCYYLFETFKVRYYSFVVVVFAVVVELFVLCLVRNINAHAHLSLLLISAIL